MLTPGFPPGTLDENGFPAWITGLATPDPNHTVHVIRGLAPPEALRALGVGPEMITSCQLPARRPDEWTSLPRAAIGLSPAGSMSVLLAGQVGAWTFVYDDGGATGSQEDPEDPWQFPPTAKKLSAGGREAASSWWSINADRDFHYAVNGELLFDVYDSLDPADDGIPASLRTAVAAAAQPEPGDEPDDIVAATVNMRMLCALAGLTVTLDELRGIPLLAAPLD